MSLAKVRVGLAYALLAGAGALGGPQLALAHHSFALFDHVHRITVTGTVVKFDWTNPHVFIQLAVPDGAAVKQYSIECASPNVLTRVGWKWNDVKAGDKVTLLVNPLKSGQPGGMLEKATLADGRVLSDGNPPGGVFPRQRQ
ncbi:MAG TPA: DUF6152 family protein [Steroidobacteraceae bacterium]|nr:DUF6152 family protein [Steroidobacteraceae bacterium]